ncbi:PAS domain S-box protein, partial [Kaarinaea lacus]
MNWLTVAWSMCSGICVMLGLLHFLLWASNRNLKYLLSVNMAFSAAACAMLELNMLQSTSIPNYQLLLQYQNLFVYVLLISMVWLVYLQLSTARRWVAYVISAMWSIGIVNNFMSPGSLVYKRIDELKQQTSFWGERFTVASGVENPWVWLVNIATLLILIYVVDASIRAWRYGDKQSAGVIGGGIVVFLLFGLIHSVLVDTGTIESPYMVSFAYLAIVMAMSFDLVSDAVRVPQLTQEIKINEKRWRDLLENVHLAVIAINPKGFISYTNPFFEKLSGYSVNSLRDKALVTLLPEDERKEFATRLEQATKTGPRPHSQWTIICDSGEQRQLAWSAVRQNDNNGKFAGILAVGADI